MRDIMYSVFWIGLVLLFGSCGQGRYAHRIAALGPYFVSGARFNAGTALDAAAGIVPASPVQEWHGSVQTSFLD